MPPVVAFYSLSLHWLWQNTKEINEVAVNSEISSCFDVYDSKQTKRITVTGCVQLFVYQNIEISHGKSLAKEKSIIIVHFYLMKGNVMWCVCTWSRSFCTGSLHLVTKALVTPDIPMDRFGKCFFFKEKCGKDNSNLLQCKLDSCLVPQFEMKPSIKRNDGTFNYIRTLLVFLVSSYFSCWPDMSISASTPSPVS